MVLSSVKMGLPVREALPCTHLSMQMRDSWGCEVRYEV